MKRHNAIGPFDQFSTLVAQTQYDVPKPFAPEDRVYLWRGVEGDVRFIPLFWNGCMGRMGEIFCRVQMGRGDVEDVVRRWREPASTAEVPAWNDAPMVGSFFPAISGRAASALAELLRDDSVLLPVRQGSRTYYCVLPRLAQRALNPEQSLPVAALRWNYWLEPRYSRYAFHPEVTRSRCAFMIPEEPCKVFVTDRFVRRVLDARLVGFNFAIVFPLKPKDRWERLADANLRKHLAEGLKPGESVRGVQVTAVFVLDHLNRIPRPGEERQIRTWAKRVDQLLWDRRSTEVPCGHLEEVVPDTGECRVCFRGPDAKKLRERIEALIPDARWPGPVRLRGK